MDNAVIAGYLGKLGIESVRDLSIRERERDLHMRRQRLRIALNSS